MEVTRGDRAFTIRRDDYEAVREGMKHLFLVGDLRRDPPHPFVRDPRLEVILTRYGAGDDGEFHWHPEVTEYEMVLDGEIGTLDAASGETCWNTAGDLIVVPAGVCVRRLVRRSVRTLALKVPSDARKVHCDRCDRTCARRVAPFGG